MNILINLATDPTPGQLTDSQKALIGGVFLIIAGLSTLIFGGTETVKDDYTEFNGFRFGNRETRPTTRAESWFWGIAMLLGGGLLVHLSK